MSNVAIFKLPPEERPESETHLCKHLARVAYFETAGTSAYGTMSWLFLYRRSYVVLILEQTLNTYWPSLFDDIRGTHRGEPIPSGSRNADSALRGTGSPRAARSSSSDACFEEIFLVL
jgi:hypothetical protein